MSEENNGLLIARDIAEEKLEAAMLDRGIAGLATVDRTKPDDFTLKFERADGVRVGLTGEGMTAKRSEEDMVAIAAVKMAEWFERFDTDPQFRADVE